MTNEAAHDGMRCLLNAARVRPPPPSPPPAPVPVRPRHRLLVYRLRRRATDTGASSPSLVTSDFIRGGAVRGGGMGPKEKEYAAHGRGLKELVEGACC